MVAERQVVMADDDTEQQGGADQAPLLSIADDADAEHRANRGDGVTYTRDQVTFHLPSTPRGKTTREDYDMPTITSYAARVSGGQPQSLPPKWLALLDKTVGLRPWLLSQVAQQDADAARTYSLALSWMDRHHFPPAGQKDLPNGLLAELAAQARCSERTIGRRLRRAEDILASLSVTLS